MNLKRLLTHLWIIIAIFIANLSIVGPFLVTEYSGHPWNNGYIYTAISRIFRDYRWTWNPMHYGGEPFRFLYPPVFHILTASLPFVSVGRAFHIVTALAYALIPVCLYLLAFELFHSRSIAGLAAIAYSIFPSPVYYLLPSWKVLATPYGNAPWGFVAVVGYEEAGHALAFSFTLLAIRAACRNKWIWSASLAALAFLTNVPALLGLALALCALGVSRARNLGFMRAGLQVFATSGTAYGLAAFWLTPGYLFSSGLLNRVVIRHTNTISPWNSMTALILAGAAILIAGALFWRRLSQAYSFLLAWIAVSGAVVACFSLAGNWLVPLPQRHMLELNAALILALTGLFSLFTERRNLVLGCVLILGTVLSTSFLSRAWTVQSRSVEPQSLLPFQVAKWLNTQAGTGRVLASGELESSLGIWSDVPNVGGTGQNVANPLIFAAQRQVAFGCGVGSDTIANLWLQALDTDYLVVHSAQSREYFHWFSDPSKFATLPVGWSNGVGDTIYRIPDLQEAAVVDLEEFRRLPVLRSTDDVPFLEAYVKWARGKRPAFARHLPDGHTEISATLSPGEAILWKTNYDQGWKTSNASLERDPIGFLLIKSSPGSQHLLLRFGASSDVWIGSVITALTIILLFCRVPGWAIAVFALAPALIGYYLLASTVPSSIKPAEEAFIRLQPPLISPGGLVDSAYQGAPFRRGSVILMYGMNFGSKNDSADVWLGDRKAEVVVREPGLIAFKLPPDAQLKSTVSVTVNGCRGNEFVLDAR